MMSLFFFAFEAKNTDQRRKFLSRSWKLYKKNYIADQGFVLDRSEDRVTSEGQAYALVRAVWMRDQETFDRVLEWTENHLLIESGLYAWLWNPSKKFLVEQNTAADADQEIAFALILASHAFRQKKYLNRAQNLLVAIRTHERLEVPSGWFPAAGNWAVEERIVNLSYFYPYAYPYFNQIDPEGDWLGVLQTGYELLFRTLGRSQVNLIPDFMMVDSEGTPKFLPECSDLSGQFSYDAMRIYWRMAIDCQLHQRSIACKNHVHPLSIGFIADIFVRDRSIYACYSYSGEPLEKSESLSFYGSVLPWFKIHFPQLAQSILNKHLSQQTLKEIINKKNRYYDLNWVWFGLAAIDGLIKERTPKPEEILD